MESSNSDTDSDYEIPSLLDEPISMNKLLLPNPIYGEDTLESSSNLTHNLIQTTATYVPLIAAHIILENRPHGGFTLGRCYVPRDRKKPHEQILKDYFMGEDSKYSSDTYRRCFRMDHDLFNRILQAITSYDDYFKQKVDAIGRAGLSPLQKVMAPLRMLAYGVPADYVDEYIQIGQSISIESLIHFCDSLIRVFREWYLRKPNDDDITRLFQQNEARGFPCMLGSLDCMHWHWNNFPKAWHGM